MSILFRSILLVIIASPMSAEAQVAQDREATSAPLVGVFSGIGSGPVSSATFGAELTIPVWRHLAIRGEVSQWGSAFSGTDCVAVPPESHRCSVGGWAGLIGVAARVPIQAHFSAYGSMSVGQFSRDFLEENFRSTATAFELGASARLSRRLSVRMNGRHLRVRDADYEMLLDEALHYTMAVLALEYTVPLHW